MHEATPLPSTHLLDSSVTFGLSSTTARKSSHGKPCIAFLKDGYLPSPRMPPPDLFPPTPVASFRRDNLTVLPGALFCVFSVLLLLAAVTELNEVLPPVLLFVWLVLLLLTISRTPFAKLTSCAVRSMRSVCSADAPRKICS